MHVRQSLVVLPLLAAILLSSSFSSAQKPAAVVPDRELQRRSFATQFLHALNAAEQDYKKKHGKFASWQALYGDGYFTTSGTKWVSDDFPTVGHAMYNNAAEVVPGWKLRLSLSNDASAYDALLQDVTDAKCGYAVLSDERGVIRQAQFVSCAH